MCVCVCACVCVLTPPALALVSVEVPPTPGTSAWDEATDRVVVPRLHVLRWVLDGF